MNFKIAALVIISIIYVYELFLTVIQMRSVKNRIPSNVADVYDKETYEKWRSYHAEKTRFDAITSTASFIIGFVLFAMNIYAVFAGLFPEGDFWQMFAVLLMSGISSLLMLPFSWHETMGIEEKYGFNKAKPGTFWADEVKSFLIELILMTAIGAALMWLHHALGDWLILAFTALLMLLILAVTFLYPVLSRIFNKFTPLEEGGLKDKLTALLEKNGYHVRGIMVMDASRRTTKANAYFSGFGKMKTIVLYDTLLTTMTTDEICAVFAHELGHGLHRDTLKNQMMTFLRIFILAVLAWLTLRTDKLFLSFGFESVNYGFALILIMSVEFSLIAPLFGLPESYFSRKAEYRADAHAVSEGYGKDLISALKKLARQDYADLAPSPLLVKLTYSHPTLSQRIDAIYKNN